MSYVLIALVCSNLVAGCHVSVVDYNLTQSDCSQALRYKQDTAIVEFKCEVQGANWEGENWQIQK